MRGSSRRQRGNDNSERERQEVRGKKDKKEGTANKSQRGRRREDRINKRVSVF